MAVAMGPSAVVRSYVVNLNAVKMIRDNEVVIGMNSIPLSRSRKKEMIALYKKRSQ